MVSILKIRPFLTLKGLNYGPKIFARTDFSLKPQKSLRASRSLVIIDRNHFCKCLGFSTQQIWFESRLLFSIIPISSPAARHTQVPRSNLHQQLGPLSALASPTEQTEVKLQDSCAIVHCAVPYLNRLFE